MLVSNFYLKKPSFSVLTPSAGFSHDGTLNITLTSGSSKFQDIGKISDDFVALPKYSSCFKCDLCSRAFSLNSQLTIHYNRVHLKQKKYSCSHCDFKTGYAHSMKRHAETNRKTCLFCLKLVCSLQVHVKDHCRSKREKVNSKAGLKMKVPCPICGKMILKYTLKKHIRDVHEKTKKCEECDIIMEHHLMHKLVFYIL